ncbi:hypothetical protein FQA39_LY12180 [Lamprigera yunnana]|nr:hypothetical protein FQA39_LY12180 [Lamprigera yunnana]
MSFSKQLETVISPKFNQDILVNRIQDIFNLDKVVINDIEFKSDQKRGESYLSEVNAFTVKASGKCKSDNEIKEICFPVISKSLPKSVSWQKTFRLLDFFQNEDVFYTIVWKAMNDFQLSKRSEPVFHHLPLYISSLCDGRNDYIVLKDMNYKNYVGLSRINSLDVEHVQMIINIFARFHALGFAFKHQKPHEFEVIANALQEGYVSARYRGWYKNYVGLSRINSLDVEHVQMIINIFARFHALGFAFKHQKPHEFEVIANALQEGYVSARYRGWYKNYVGLSRINSLDVEHVQMIINIFARFHALGFAFKHQKPHEFEVIANALQEGYVSARYRGWYKNYVGLSRINSLDVEHVQMIINIFARFHALGFAFKHQKPHEFEVIANALQEGYVSARYRGWYKNYVGLSRINSLDVEHVQMIINIFARFHALGFAFKHQKPHEFEVIANALQTSLSSLRIGHVQFKTFSITYTCRKLVEYFENKGSLAVITHGDAWIPNFLFKYNSDEVLHDAVLIDFQQSGYASLAIDLTSFLYCCTEQSLRLKYWDILIGNYHKTFIDTLLQLGSDPQLVTFDMLRNEIKTYALFGAIISVEAVIMSLLENDDFINYEAISGDEAVPLEEIFIFHPFTSEEKRQRIADIIKHAMDYKLDNKIMSFSKQLETVVSTKFTQDILVNRIQDIFNLDNVVINDIEFKSDQKKGDSYLSEVNAFTVKASGKCKRYVSSLCDGTNDYVVLENMNYKDFVGFSRINSLDIEHVQMIINIFARFHALGFAFKNQKPHEFEVTANALQESYVSERYRGWYKNYQTNNIFPILHDAIEKQLPEYYLGRFKEIVSNDFYGKLVKYSEHKGSLAVITHGDAWTPNFLFKYDADKVVSDAVLIDFQLSRYASLAIDLTLFLYCCTEQSLRLRYWDILIENYHKTFIDILVQLGSNPQLVTLDMLRNEIKTYALFGAIMSIEAVTMSLLEDDEVANLENISGEEVVPLEEVLIFHPFTSEEKRQRIADIIKHAIDNNFINNKLREISLSIISKSIPRHIGWRNTFRSADFFRNEIAFYNVVWKAMNEFQLSKVANPVFHEVPLCISAFGDGNNDYITLENMTPKEYNGIARSDGLSLEYTQLIMRLFARFHALGLAFKDQKPEEFEKAVGCLEETYFAEKYRKWYINFQVDNLFPLIRDAVTKELPESYLLKVNQLFETDFYGKLIDYCAAKGQLAVVTHGDAWAPNFLVKNTDDVTPDAIIIDFQLCRYASLALDITFFLYSCTQPSLWLLHWDALIEDYHKVFVSTLETLGSSRQLLTLDALKAEIKSCALFGVGMSMEAVTMSLLDDEEVADLKGIADDQFIPLEKVWILRPFKSKEKRQRIADLVKHAVDNDFM